MRAVTESRLRRPVGGKSKTVVMLHRASKLDDANGNAALHSIDQRLFKEDLKPYARDCDPLHAL